MTTKTSPDDKAKMKIDLEAEAAASELSDEELAVVDGGASTTLNTANTTFNTAGQADTFYTVSSFPRPVDKLKR